MISHRFAFLVVSACGFVALAGCNKFELEAPLSNPDQMFCLNGRDIPGVGRLPNRPSESAKSTLVFRDEFNGRDNDPGDSTNTNTAECYDMTPVCSERLDWFHYGTCSTTNFANLRDLNKCKWTVWDGYSFWDNSRLLAYSPEALSISGGNLNITFKKRPGVHTDCGPGPQHGDGYGRDCGMISGGVDSKYRNPTTKGFNVTDQRVEMNVSVPSHSGAWPALWTWTGNANEGYPHVQNGNLSWTGEIDILELIPGGGTFEALQTYHTWNHGAAATHYSTGAVKTEVQPNSFYTYGVERMGTSLAFYVEDCYTRVIQNGDTDDKGNANSIKVDATPEFMMMSMGFDKNYLSGGIDSLEGATYKINYVRVYQ